MLKRTLALSVISLTLTASSAHAIDLKVLKRGTPVASLGVDFTRNFVKLEEQSAADLNILRKVPFVSSISDLVDEPIYGGTATLNGKPFVTYLRLTNEGTIAVLSAERQGASLQDYFDIAEGAQSLLPPKKTWGIERSLGPRGGVTDIRVDDCGSMFRAIGVRRGEAYLSHFAIPGKSQRISFTLGEAEAAALQREVANLQTLPGNRPPASAADRVLEKPPTFELTCRNEISGPLPFPGIGAVTEATLRALGAQVDSRYPGLESAGYAYAGIAGVLNISRENGKVIALNWNSSSPNTLSEADEKRWLQALSRDMGLPSGEAIEEGDNKRDINRKWKASEADEVSAMMFLSGPKGKRTFSINWGPKGSSTQLRLLLNPR